MEIDNESKAFSEEDLSQVQGNSSERRLAGHLRKPKT